MNIDEFNTLSEKLYPDRLDREDAKLAIKMIVTTEKHINAEKNFEEAQKEIRTYLDEHNHGFPGSFLIPPHGAYTWLRELTNFTFGE